MSMVMCKCRSCGVQVGVKTGLSGGGHFVNLCLVLLTGFIWVIPYVLIMAVSGSTRCSKCGKSCKSI